MNYFLLLLCIIIPVILPIILCFKIKGHSPKSIAGWKNTFKISPNEWLLSQSLFWCSLLIPFLLFTSFGIISWREHDLNLSTTGFNTFLDISKLPLWLLAIAAPFSVIIARAHGTEQTATQIKELIKKNNSDSYQSQRNDFLTYFKDSSIGVKAYSHYYPSTIEKGALPVNEELILKTREIIKHSISVLRNMYIEHNNEYSDFDSYYRLAIDSLIKTENIFTILTFKKALENNTHYYSDKDTTINGNTKQYKKFPLVQTKTLVESLIELTSTYNKLCEYTHSHHEISNDDKSLEYANYLLSRIPIEELYKIDTRIDSINAKADTQITIFANPILQKKLQKKN